MSTRARIRQMLGVLAYDAPRYVAALAAPGSQYLSVHNRGERLEAAPQNDGYRCLWPWTSDLHAPQLIPALGGALMRRALRDHPIKRTSSRPPQRPLVSFVIGHRGTERLPLLRATLESIAGQRGAAVECVVVEQDHEARLPFAGIPDWVRYVHAPPPDVNSGYNRSWAFNVGVRHASGELLVLHDNDILVSEDYSSMALRVAGQGYDVINLKRFIFYLGQKHAEAFLRGDCNLDDTAPESIMQNALGGGSIAISRAAYESIGAFDEGFVGWGGEDVEFWERAATCRVWPYGSLPMVHLWHEAQAGKAQRQREMLARWEALRAVPATRRIARLRQLAWGAMEGPKIAPALF